MATTQITMNMSNISNVAGKISKARIVSKITCEKVRKKHLGIAEMLEEMLERIYMPQQRQFKMHDTHIAQAASGNESRIVSDAMMDMFLLLKETIANEKKITGNVAKAIESVFAINEMMAATELEYLRTLSSIKRVCNEMTLAKRNYFLSHKTLQGENKDIPEDQLYEMDITVVQLDEDEQVEGQEDDDDDDDDSKDQDETEDGVKKKKPKKKKKAAYAAKNMAMRRIHASAQSQFRSSNNNNNNKNAAAPPASVDYGIFFHKKYNANMLRLHGIIQRNGFAAISLDDKKMLLQWFQLCTKNIDTKIINCRSHITTMQARFTQFEKLTVAFHAQLDELEKLADYQHRVHLVDV